MTLEQFRELTKDLPGDVELIIEAKGNPFGNVWSASAVEATQISFLGDGLPAVKISSGPPEYADPDSERQLFVDPSFGRWAL